MSDWANVLADIGIIVPIDREQFTIQCPFHEDTVDSCAINTDKVFGFVLQAVGKEPYIVSS